MLFMSLLTAPIFKNSRTQARTYFIFLKNGPKSPLIPKFGFSEKPGKAVTK